MIRAPFPDISVIIPHLNQPEHLDNCLRSLAGQDYDLVAVEIIVVDNGSRELPTEICGRYADVHLISELTPGPGPARNKGISVARAPILAFIDADCIAEKHWLQAIGEAFSDPQTQVIGGDVRIALADPDRITMLEAYESIYAYRQQEYIEQQGFSGTGNLAMRRTVFERVGPFAGPDIAEDIDWGRRARQLGYKIFYISDMKVFHPGRKDFHELAEKWDRHTAHFFEVHRMLFMGRVRWATFTIAIALSPLAETVRIINSDRITGSRTRTCAFVALIRIRLHRSRTMAWLLFGGNPNQMTRNWNRD